jgi:hypothetical protein
MSLQISYPPIRDSRDRRLAEREGDITSDQDARRAAQTVSERTIAVRRQAAKTAYRQALSKRQSLDRADLTIGQPYVMEEAQK